MSTRVITATESIAAVKPHGTRARIPRARQKRQGGRLGRGVAFLLGTIWLIIVIAPFDYMVVSSLHSQADYFTANPWIPTAVTFDNISAVFQIGLGDFIRNSAVVVITGLALTLVMTLMFAQHTVKHKAKPGAFLFKVIAVGLAVPMNAIVVPLFIVVTHINLYDNLLGLILIMSASNLPISVVILCTFVRDIPDELVDAMKIDGAGSWTILFRLVLPMSTGAIGLLAIFDGLAMWNNMLIPLLFTQSPNNALLPLSLFKFEGQYGSDVPALMMAVLLSALPLIILFLLTRRFAMQALGGIATMR